jgi:hypothetical protein
MQSPIVVLGSGPTAVFAVEFLAGHGIEANLVGTLVDASILPIPTPDGPVSLLPVFPTLPPPAYPPSVATDKPLLVRRIGSPAWVQNRHFLPNSLVSWLLPDEAAAAMAVKQFGARALTAPLDQVRKKIQRAYSGQPIRRAGYVNGLSPYLAPMLEAIKNRGMRPRAVRLWSPSDHLIEFQNGVEAVEYERLMYVADLGQLVQSLGVEVDLPARAAATFSTYFTEDPLTANQLVYDLSADSPVFRAFAATERVVVVQESQMDDEDASALSLATRVSEAFQIDLRRFGDRLVHSTAYPVESLSEDCERSLSDACAKLDILRFGRNARNRYVDLHELVWEEVRAWATQ